MRLTRDEMYMRMAYAATLRSTCVRKSVGALALSSDARKMSIGYNGNAHGLANGCDTLTPGRCGCIHAEENALLKADFPVGTLYTTCAPCEHCAKRIVNAQVPRVVYNEAYRDPVGLSILRQAGIEVVGLARDKS